MDNVATLTVEEYLLNKLPDVFNSDVTDGLSDEAIESIAAETDESKAERASSMRKLEILKRTRAVLQRLDRQTPKGTVCSSSFQSLTDSSQACLRPSMTD